MDMCLHFHSKCRPPSLPFVFFGKLLIWTKCCCFFPSLFIMNLIFLGFDSALSLSFSGSNDPGLEREGEGRNEESVVVVVCGVW